ncbi:MAG TPA: CBS domain-containing protein [Kofleriaceae bacterium]|nr:CBS domain-containing protein [Kofleriaceae bacterium]
MNQTEHHPSYEDVDFEDEITSELPTLGMLIASTPPAPVVDLRTPLAEARRLLRDEHVPALVVIGTMHALLGVVTRADVLRDDATTVAEVMNASITALPSTATIHAAAALMAHDGIDELVVTRPDGSFAGIVSTLDVVRYFANRA